MQFCSLFSYICYVKLKHPSQQRHWLAFHYLIFNNLLVIEPINISYSCREIFCIVSVYYIILISELIYFFLIWTLHLDIFIIKTVTLSKGLDLVEFPGADHQIKIHARRRVWSDYPRLATRRSGSQSDHNLYIWQYQEGKINWCV